MNKDSIILLKGDEIISLFRGHETEVMEIVKEAYKTHSKGDSTLPHSSFLRFPGNERDRIIALPAYLGGDFAVAGIKWIASFPKNIESGIERASAILVLNSTQTGHPKAIMESSVISAKRTAAGAAAAAHCLLEGRRLHRVGMIGCGLINFETFRFILAARPEVEALFIYDLDAGRAEQFKQKCVQLTQTVEITILKDINSVLEKSQVLSLATTASKPHMTDLSAFSPDGIILHTSLRDLSPDIILATDNIVDDVDHVCRAQTSVHLAEQQTGNRDFIRCTIGDILNGNAKPREKGKLAVYSPFGLGVQDIALGDYVYRRAIENNIGLVIDSFLPTNWLERSETD